MGEMIRFGLMLTGSNHWILTGSRCAHAIAPFDAFSDLRTPRSEAGKSHSIEIGFGSRLLHLDVIHYLQASPQSLPQAFPRQAPGHPDLSCQDH